MFGGTLNVSGQIGARRLEVGYRRDDHHVAGFARRHGFHVRRSCSKNVEEHFVGIVDSGLLVYRIPRT